MKILFSLLLGMVLAYARLNPFVLPSQESSIQSSHTSEATNKSSQSTSSGEQPRKTLSYGFGQIEFYDDRFIVKTKDSLKKSFLLDKPKKIVLDFASSRHFETKNQKLDIPLFRRVQVGSHKNFYRIAVTIEGPCKLRIKKQSGYQVFCR